MLYGRYNLIELFLFRARHNLTIIDLTANVLKASSNDDVDFRLINLGSIEAETFRCKIKVGIIVILMSIEIENHLVSKLQSMA